MQALAVACSDEHLYFLDPSTGSTLASVEIGVPLKAPPVADPWASSSKVGTSMQDFYPLRHKPPVSWPC